RFESIDCRRAPPARRPINNSRWPSGRLAYPSHVEPPRSGAAEDKIACRYFSQSPGQTVHAAALFPTQMAVPYGVSRLPGRMFDNRRVPLNVEKRRTFDGARVLI